MFPQEMQTPNLRRVVWSSLIGTTVEWYDFFLYGVVAGIVLDKLYFPNPDPLVSTLLAYTTFAVGFVTRPLGGAIFGYFGDRVGRKSVLVTTLLIMGGATFCIGLIPTYAEIGMAAPLLLLLLRVLQGIGLGGEWGGAVLMAFEYAPPEKRGFYASIPQIGLAIGLCLASGIVALLGLLPEADFLRWGWRAAFELSAVLVFVGLYIRTRVAETPEFTRLKAAHQEAGAPIVEVIRNYPRNILLGMGARYIDGVFFNILGVFSIVYLVNTLQVPRSTALLGVSGAALLMIAMIPYFGALSDRVGRRRVYAIGALVAGLSTFPTFWLLDHAGGNTIVIWLAIIVPFGIVFASIFGPEAALFAELFDARVRYSGISLVYQFSGIFASGITPIIATALLDLGGKQPWLICCYVLFAAIVSAVCTMLIGGQKHV